MRIKSLAAGILALAGSMAAPVSSEASSLQVVLVGHGIPFWIASTLYVTVCILVFRRLSRDPLERRLDARAWVLSLVIGATSSIVTWLVFERVFLVRLP